MDEKVKEIIRLSEIDGVLFDRHEVKYILSLLSEKEGEIKRLTIELGEAQQWIDSEPNWKDKYNKQYLDLVQLLKEKNKEIAKLQKDK